MRIRQVRARFLAALLITIAGALLGAGAFTFSRATERWLSLGVGAAVLLVLAVAFAGRGRGTVQPILDLPLALICAWAIVAGRVVESSGAGSSAHSVRWLCFGVGAAIASLGLTSLLLHERAVERDLASVARYAARLQSSAPGHTGADERGRSDGAHEPAERSYADAISRTAG